MTIIEFLKSLASQDTQMGDLAKDVIADREFPYDSSEKEIISYLEFKTRRHGTNDIFQEMITAFENKKKSISDPTSLEINFTPMKSEQWSYLKKHFTSDRVITVGKPGEIYRIFGVDTARGQALRFDIYTTRNLNDLSIVSVSDIQYGEITNEVTLIEAIEALEALSFDDNRQPKQPNYVEMLDYLKNQLM